MLVVMKKDATETNIQAVVDAVEKRGYVARPIPGGDRVSIGILYNKGSVDTSQFLGFADVVQIGTRTMQNYSLLKRAGRSMRPVVLKRGMPATLQEWLMAAEYIMEEGNHNVILCERGIRTFVKHSRNTLDLSVIMVVKKESHLPVIVDPSHAAGVRDQVVPLAFAATTVGADGLMIEVHNKPEIAMSDGAQSLYPDQFKASMEKIKTIHSL